MSTGDPQYYIQTTGSATTSGNIITITTTTDNTNGNYYVYVPQQSRTNSTIINTWNFTKFEPDPRYMEVVEECNGRKKFIKRIRPIDAFDEFEALCPICEEKMVRGTMNTDPFCWDCVVNEILSLIRDKSTLKMLKALNAYLEIHITAYNSLNNEEETIVKVIGY